MKKPADRQWGSLQSDGSWTGMINEVHQKRIDMGNSDFIGKTITNHKLLLFFSAVATFTATFARSAVVTFTEPILYYHHSLFIKNPTGSFNLKAYLDPLKFLTWISILVFCLVVPPFLFITTQ